MIETKISLEEFQWKISQDQSHQYCVYEPNYQTEFENLVTHIKKNGYIVPIQGKPYVCIDIDEYLYWTLWDSINKTNRINRMLI